MILDRYDPNGFYCDLMRCEDAAQIRARLAHLSIAELKRRAEHAEAELYNLGITFTIYTEEQAIDRTLPFDVIPRVLSAAEWKVVESGVIQRVTALNAFLHDIYHDQHILHDGTVPEDLVLGNANYRPAMQGFDLPFHTYVHICGTDIVRDQTGRFMVLEDNARTPSGVSYVVENRHLMLRSFPDLLDGIGLRPVDDYGLRLAAALVRGRAAGHDEPRGRAAVAGVLQLGVLRACLPGARDGRDSGRGARPDRGERPGLYEDHRRTGPGARDLSAHQR